MALSALQLEGFLALGHTSGILREGPDSIGLGLGVGESVKELALEGSRQGGDGGCEGQGAGVGLWEGDPEGGCGAALVGLVMENT